jgi:formylmethanofuran dehydrogenase subunit E
MIHLPGRDAILDRISEFHGHLGPYVVVGYRMGLVGNKVLGGDPFQKSAVVLTGAKTPRSCVVDGVQLSSGCTLGKGNIAVLDHGKVAAIFTSKKDDRTVRVSLKEEHADRIRSTPTEALQDLAEELYSLTDEQLFDVS